MSRVLSVNDAKGPVLDARATVEFTITVIPSGEGVEATFDHSGIMSTAGIVQHGEGTIVTELTWTELWNHLLNQTKLFMDIMVTIPEVYHLG